MAREHSKREKERSTTGSKEQRSSQGRFPAYIEEGSNSYRLEQSSRGGDFRERRPYQMGRGRNFVVRCYTCNKIGHKSNECLENTSTNIGSIHIIWTYIKSLKSLVHENALEVGESLIMKRILLKSAKENKEPSQRKTLFKIIYKSKGKCCKIVIDSGSTDNMVSTTMLQETLVRRAFQPKNKNEMSKCIWYGLEVDLRPYGHISRG